MSTHAGDTRLLEDIARIGGLTAPSGIERLEAEVGRKRLSQLLLLVALCPEDDSLLYDASPATRAA